MTALEREATIRWLTHPPEGVPRLSVGSESLRSLPLDVNPEAAHPLATSPGELLAGAVGSAFAWLAAEELVKEGTQARELTAYVTLTLSGEADDGTDMALSAIACKLIGRVPGLDQARMEAVAQAAMTRCIEALGMRTEGLAVTVEGSLEGA
jgi:organic hydroperoxide reductase OsmC/OhrA